MLLLAVVLASTWAVLAGIVAEGPEISDQLGSARSAVQEVEMLYQLPVVTIATLDDVMQFLAADSARAQQMRTHRPAVERYRERYGA